MTNSRCACTSLLVLRLVALFIFTALAFGTKAYRGYFAGFSQERRNAAEMFIPPLIFFLLAGYDLKSGKSSTRGIYFTSKAPIH